MVRWNLNDTKQNMSSRCSGLRGCLAFGYLHVNKGVVLLPRQEWGLCMSKD